MPDVEPQFPEPLTDLFVQQTQLVREPVGSPQPTYVPGTSIQHCTE